MEAAVLPPHPPLGGTIRPFEMPVDGTQFQVPEAERDLPMTVDFKKNLALRGCVDPDLVYPFLFSSNTLSFQYLLSSTIPTKYSGLGIRYSSSRLSAKENSDGVAAYHYLLDETVYAAFLNKTLALAAEGLRRAEDPRARVRLLTGNALVLVLTLRRMQQTAAALEAFDEFPLLTLRRGLVQLVCGLYEEVWAVGYQMAPDDATAYSSAALVRAAAAYYYYTEAGKTDLLKGFIGPTIENAKRRVTAVLIGWITSRIERSRATAGAGADIPWEKAGTTMIAGKYRATVFAGLGVVVRKGKELKPPAPRYAAAYAKAVDQCRANLLTASNGTFMATSHNVDPYAQTLQIGADWAASKPGALFSEAAHPKARSAQELWAWSSDSRACPEGLEQLFNEGKKRYTAV